jgi:mono/diheme cytochrome c family protein
MRYVLLVFALLVVMVIGIAGRRGDLSRRPPIELFPDMDRQPKLRPQEPNKFFSDGLSSRLPVPGAVARGAAFDDSPANTGKVPGTTNWVELLPVPVTAELLARGQERYNIYCAVCHGAQGDGKGVATKPLYGLVGVANFHEPRLVKMPDGQFFHTITHGSPAQLMLGYGSQIELPDRWAIVAYVRALQRSRLATLDDVPANVREQLSKSLPPAAAPAK